MTDNIIMGVTILGLIVAFIVIHKHIKKRMVDEKLGDAELEAKLQAIKINPHEPLSVTADMQAKLDAMPRNARKAWLRKYRKSLKKELADREAKAGGGHE